MNYKTENLRQYSWRQEFGDQFNGRRVLVTGARGFVGSYLCEALLSLGAKVYGTKLNTLSDNEVDGIRFMSVDLRNQQAAKEIVEASNPDFTYHLAALVDTHQQVDLVLPALQHNLVGTLHLLMALLDRQCQRIVITSSSETPPHGQAPNSPYAASKLAMMAYAEMFHTLYGLPVVMARPHMTYGPRQPEDKLIPYVICSILENTSPMLSSGGRICDMVYVKDVVRGLLCMAISNAAVGCTFDIGTGKGVSIREIVTRITALMRTSCFPIFGDLTDRVGEFPQIADIKNSCAALGWQPRWTMDEGLIETIEWYTSPQV